jgi:hypothetical protein
MTRRLDSIRPRFARRDERGTTLMELIVVVTILGLIVSALTTAWFISLRGTRQAARGNDGPRNNNALAFWMASDISSATPVDVATWLNTTPATTSGCSVTPAGTTNVLRIETRNPRKIGAASEQYVASYRYRTMAGGGGELVRTFCLKGGAPIASGALVEDIAPTPLVCGAPVCVTIPVDKSRATITFAVARPDGTPYVVTQSAAIRVPEIAPTTALPAITTTLPVEVPCSFTDVTLTPPNPTPIPRVTGPGAARPLSLALAISITTAGSCEKVIAQVTGETNYPGGPSGSKVYTCTLLASGAVWSGGCFRTTSAPHQEFKAQGYAISLFNRVDDGDPAASPSEPPTDVPLPYTGASPAPSLSLLVS